MPRSDEPDLEVLRDSGGVSGTCRERHFPTETLSKSMGLNRVSLLASSLHDVLSEGDRVMP
jgi:hypothetical protein